MDREFLIFIYILCYYGSLNCKEIFCEHNNNGNNNNEHNNNEDNKSKDNNNSDNKSKDNNNVDNKSKSNNNEGNKNKDNNDYKNKDNNDYKNKDNNDYKNKDHKSHNKDNYINNELIRNELNNNNEEIYNKERNILIRSPILICACILEEIISVDIDFKNNIVSLLEVNNEVGLDRVNLVLGKPYEKKKGYREGILIYEGKLKTYIKYLEPNYMGENQLSAESKYYMVVSKLNSSKKVIVKESDCNKKVLDNIIVHMDKVRFTVNKNLVQKQYVNENIELYRGCNLIIDLRCNIRIFQENIYES